jgi:HK97 family phage major capsid protein
MDELNEMHKTVHEYRKTLEGFAARKDAQTHEITRAGSGEEREKIARMDADLDAAERLIQLRAMERKAREETRAQFDSRPAPGGMDVSSTEYRNRWVGALVRGDVAEMRALSLSSSNAGIPTDMERRIVERLRQETVMRQLATVTQIDSKRTITIENALPTTALVTEGSSITASDPSFSTAISVVPYKFATRNTMSQEFIEDAIGMTGIGGGLNYVADRCAKSIALSQEDYLTTGTGSSQPQGIAGGAVTQIEDIGAGGSGNSFSDDATGDTLINAVHRISPQYRTGPKFSWVLHDTVVQSIRKLKTGSSLNDYIWKPTDNGGIADGIPGTIYGIPYRINAYMGTATTTTNGTVVGIVGNFNYFEMFERTGITSMLDPYSAASTHQVNLYLYTRWDSKVMLPEAFAAITV